MFWIWLGIVVALAFIELITVNLTTVWFVVSALVSLLFSFFIDNFVIQFSIFVIVGIILLCTTRKYLVNLLRVKEERTNLDRIIGMEGIVTEEIRKNNSGEVKVDGKRWTAYADKKITVDKTVKVLLINGVKIKVEEVDK